MSETYEALGPIESDEVCRRQSGGGRRSSFVLVGSLLEAQEKSQTPQSSAASDVQKAENTLPPLVLRSLSDYLKSRDVVTAVWDIHCVSVPHDLGAPRFPAETAARVLALAPDIVGLSFACWDWEAQISLATELRALRPNLRIIAGGHAAEALGIELLDLTPAIDMVALTEGEIILERLLLTDWDCLKEFPWTAWRDADGIAYENLGRPPILAPELLPMPGNSLLYPASRYCEVEFSRGCFGTCAYCRWSRAQDLRRTLRYAPANRIASALAVMRESGIRKILIVDASVNYTREQCEALVTAADLADPGKTLSFAYNIHANHFDDEHAIMLSTLRTIHVGIGMDTLNPHAARLAGRRCMSLAEARQKIRRAASVGPVAIQMILGLPGDDLAAFLRTFRTVMSAFDLVGEELVRSIDIFWLAVPRGSRYWQERESLGVQVRTAGVPFVVRTREMSEEDFKRAIDHIQSHPLADRCTIWGPPDVLPNMATPLFAYQRRKSCLSTVGVRQR